MAKLIVKIAKDGQISIEGDGFKGTTCLEKSKKYMRNLGIVQKDSKKPEYYEQPEVTVNNNW